MDIDKDTTLTSFEFEGQESAVNFESTIDVTDGVKCDVYSFIDDPTRDLGVIRVNKGFKTPLQRVLQGNRTVEGYISGEGSLVITRANGEWEVHQVSDRLRERFVIDVSIGDLMQWEASSEESLTAFEICYPPYQDGRYENIG